MTVSPPHALTAERISLAVVASAKVYGDDPTVALSSPGKKNVRRCLTPAVVGLVVATGNTAIATARLLGVDHTTVSKGRRNPTPLFQSAAIAAERAVRATLPTSPGTPPTTNAPQPDRTTPPQSEARLNSSAAVVAPACGRPQALPGRVLASANLSHHRAYAAPPPRPALRAALEAEVEQSRPLAQSASIGRAIADRRMARVVRMMPVTPEKLRFARWFLAYPDHWDLEDVAALFDVSADSLALAVERRAA